MKIIDIPRYKPPNTSWVTVQTRVECACLAPPKLMPPTIYGLRKFAFIVGHEYEIEVGLESYRRNESYLENCRDACAYDVEVKYCVRDVIVVGIAIQNLGLGTITLSRKDRDSTRTYQLQPICCDDEIEALRQIDELKERTKKRSVARALGAITSLLAVAGVTLVSIFNLNSLLARGAIASLGTAFIASLLFTGYRIWLSNRSSEDIYNEPTLRPVS
jgi:hypothetical protein